MRRLRVVIQARMSSTRLPGKVLLPFGGVPLAALVAKRVARGGFEAVVATSTDPSDDLLATEMARQGVAVVRGDLEDVLGRFVLATEDLGEDDLCVRMTADNPGPDGDFIAALAQLRDETGALYLGYGGNQIGLPYGMAAEIFTVGALRAADQAACPGPEREHVTPLIRARHRPATVPPFPGLARDYGPLRATVDSFDDYTRMAGIFAGGDPITLPWTAVMDRLAALPDAPTARVSGMVLGTVQLGLSYGAANTAGLPSEAEATKILRSAVAHGVTEIDTARAYGQSEARIGAAFSGGWQGRARVLTKLAPQVNTEAEVRASVLASAHALGLKRLPLVMVHRAEHLENQSVLEALRALVADDVIVALGASVQSMGEYNRVSELPEVEHVQVPCNLLDWRWRGLTPREGLTIHTRSAYLQGLLTPAPADRWPAIEGVDPNVITKALTALTADLNRENPRDLCLAWLRAQPWIDGVIVGVETLDQLKENIALFTRPPLTEAELAEVEGRLPQVPERLLDPARW